MPPKASGRRYPTCERVGEILLTGRRYDASAALRTGLVSEVHADTLCLERALAMAKEIDGWSTHGISMTARAEGRKPDFKD